MEKIELDYIVVGGGLAGTLIAFKLLEEGKSFRIISSEEHKSASKVAAGTWNPIAFRRMVTTWRADEMIAEMKALYPKLEDLLGEQFFNFLPSLKVLANNQEKEFWQQQALLIPNHLNPEVSEWDQLTLGEVLQTGRLNLPVFLDLAREYFNKNDLLKKETFDYLLLSKDEEHYSYKNLLVDKVIFCEGPHIGNNPYFDWLPFKHVKGDVLTLKIPGLALHGILKKNIFVLPLGNELFKVGATYDWENLNWENDEQAKQTILEKFEKVVQLPYEVVDHKAGIRPASFDRRPIIGEHPEKKGLYVFNGLGAKGVFLAPLMVKEFFAYLEQQTEIHHEVSINRYLKHYSNDS